MSSLRRTRGFWHEEKLIRVADLVEMIEDPGVVGVVAVTNVEIDSGKCKTIHTLARLVRLREKDLLTMRSSHSRTCANAEMGRR